VGYEVVGTYFGGVVSQGSLNKVDIRLGRTKAGAVVTKSGKSLAGTIHSHVGSGKVKLGGQTKTLMGVSPSDADRDQARLTGKSVFILNADANLIKVVERSGKLVTQKILTRKDYIDYLKRARKSIPK